MLYHVIAAMLSPVTLYYFMPAAIITATAVIAAAAAMLLHAATLFRCYAAAFFTLRFAATMPVAADIALPPICRLYAIAMPLMPRYAAADFFIRCRCLLVYAIIFYATR